MTNFPMTRKQKEMVRAIEHPEWPAGLKPCIGYSRLHDDHDGTGLGRLNVIIGDDGDTWVQIVGERVSDSLRFRTAIGGGSSIRTRNALMLLALAIKLDQEENPQP